MQKKMSLMRGRFFTLSNSARVFASSVNSLQSLRLFWKTSWSSSSKAHASLEVTSMTSSPDFDPCTLTGALEVWSKSRYKAKEFPYEVDFRILRNMNPSDFASLTSSGRCFFRFISLWDHNIMQRLLKSAASIFSISACCFIIILFAIFKIHVNIIEKPFKLNWIDANFFSWQLFLKIRKNENAVAFDFL